MTSQTALLMLCKVPFHAPCKTRMQPQLSEEECSLLQDAFLEDILNMTTEVPYDVFVAYSPHSGKTYFAETEQIRSHFPQVTGDLGQRMIHAVERVASRGYQKIIVIGGDSPELQPQTLLDAEQLLDQADVCLGPAVDGGYYLIGLKESNADLFQGIAWGTDQVYQQTLKKIAANKYKAASLPEGFDIDDWDDLLSLHDRLNQGSYACYPENTHHFVRKLVHNRRKMV